jgi:hypothetical protein
MQKCLKHYHQNQRDLRKSSPARYGLIMIKRLAPILLAIFSFCSIAYAIEEYGCVLMVEVSENQSTKVLPLENFSMLDYKDKVEFVGFYVPEGMKAKALMCNRSSIIPAEYDYVAILAGYPLYIKNGNRLVALERYSGKYRIREISGEKLSEKELVLVNKMLNSYQEKEQPEGKIEATKP